MSLNEKSLTMEIKHLKKHFGGIEAVNDLTFDIHEGEILGLIGPNGAGKTTVFNLISGVLRPTSGQIIFQGKAISHLKPHQITKKGIVRTFQQTATFQNMTVLENIAIGAHLKGQVGIFETIIRGKRFKKKMEKLWKHAEEILAVIGLEKCKDDVPRGLPYGYQRILGIGIALASKPKLLLLDEPATGMNASETAELLKLLLNIRDTGTTILLVEHDMKMVMGACDRIVAISFGKRLAVGTPEEVRNNEEVIKAYLGD